MPHKEPYGAFRRQARLASERGIAWHFTFEEWVKWWEENLGPTWRKLRGHKRGQFVMARHGDKGPYIINNVSCITTGQNSRDRMINNPHSCKGEEHGRAKLTEKDVTAIFHSPEKRPVLAIRYGVSPYTVRAIKRRKTWKHITETLARGMPVKAPAS